MPIINCSTKPLWVVYSEETGSNKVCVAHLLAPFLQTPAGDYGDGVKAVGNLAIRSHVAPDQVARGRWWKVSLRLTVVIWDDPSKEELRIMALSGDRCGVDLVGNETCRLVEASVWGPIREWRRTPFGVLANCRSVPRDRSNPPTRVRL